LNQVSFGKEGRNSLSHGGGRVINAPALVVIKVNNCKYYHLLLQTPKGNLVAGMKVMDCGSICGGAAAVGE
jgi:hypothetical protein